MLLSLKISIDKCQMSIGKRRRFYTSLVIQLATKSHQDARRRVEKVGITDRSF